MLHKGGGFLQEIVIKSRACTVGMMTVNFIRTLNEQKEGAVRKCVCVSIGVHLSV